MKTKRPPKGSSPSSSRSDRITSTDAARALRRAIRHVQLEAAQERVGQYRDFVTLYRSHRIVELELERTEPELCRDVRTGRLHAALTERVVWWLTRS